MLGITDICSATWLLRSKNQIIGVESNVKSNQFSITIFIFSTCSTTGNKDEISSLQWKSFNKESKHFSPSKKGFMINYQVQNIEELVSKLKENGVTILDSIETYDYGKFIHIMDNDGNKIELWEPNL